MCDVSVAAAIGRLHDGGAVAIAIHPHGVRRIERLPQKLQRVGNQRVRHGRLRKDETQRHGKVLCAQLAVFISSAVGLLGERGGPDDDFPRPQRQG